MDFLFPVILAQEPGGGISWMLQALGMRVLLIPLFLLISIGVVVWIVKSGNRRSLDEPGGSIQRGETRAVLAAICGFIACGLLVWRIGDGGSLIIIFLVEFPNSEEVRAALQAWDLSLGFSFAAAALLGLHALLFVSGASRLARTGRVSTAGKIIMATGGLLIIIGGVQITVWNRQTLSSFAVLASAGGAPTVDGLAEIIHKTRGFVAGLFYVALGSLLLLIALFRERWRKLPSEPRAGPLAHQGPMALGWFLVLFGGLSSCLLIVIASNGASSTLDVLLSAGDNVPRPSELAKGISTFYFGWLMTGNFITLWGLGQVLALVSIQNPAAGSEEPAADESTSEVESD